MRRPLKYFYLLAGTAGLLILSLVAIELITSVYRGYGYIGAITRLPAPDREMNDDLKPFAVYIERRLDNITRDDATWPMPEKIAENVSKIRLSDEQPYRQDHIWVFSAADGSRRYLYSPLRGVFNNVDDVSRVLFNREPGFLGLVVFCNMAQWQGPAGRYHPFKKYPKFVREAYERDYGGERWLCYLSATGLQSVKSELPPVPGTIVLAQDDNSARSWRCLYPKDIVPTVKKLYPNLKIPEEAIINVDDLNETNK